MTASPPAVVSLSRREAALRFLYQRIDYERTVSMPYHQGKLKLARMRELLRRLGDPQESLPIVHVAGTKGKGSTAAMVAAVLTAAGYRTGLFTSPHLVGMEERLAIDGSPCPPDEFVQLVEELAPVVNQMDAEAERSYPTDFGPTFFEVVTAMGFLRFAQRGVQVAVVEVGLGGRLDSTNVCRPRVSVITSISLDHTKQLGKTEEAIAWEKAGIIKRGVPVVSGVTHPGAREVIRAACRRKRSRLVEVEREFHFDYRPPRGLERAPAWGEVDFEYDGPGGARSYQRVRLGLVGRHQGANAAVALATLAQLQAAGWDIPESAIRIGLESLVWPARVEVLARHPVVIIDAAHNVASVEALLRTLEESFSVRKRILIFATTQEKDVAEMLRRLLPAFDHVLLTQYLDNPRAVPLAELCATARAVSGRDWPAFGRPAEAWQAARSLASAEDLICVTGSFFIAAQVRHEVQGAQIALKA